jgi:hypothetical protein
MRREEEIKQEIDLRLAGSFGDYSEGYEEGFIAGAKWADNNPTHCSVRMADSQSYSKQQLREMGFAFDLNGNVLSPNELTSKAAHYVIEKACSILEDMTDGRLVERFINEFKNKLKYGVLERH